MSVAYRFQNTKSRRKSRLRTLAPLLATSMGFVAFALCVPSNSSQKSEARIFTQGLSIQIDRSSPAYAALEDSLMEDTQPSSNAFGPLDGSSLTQVKAAKFAQTLVSGSNSAVPMAERIERETKREEALYAQERASKELAVSSAVSTLVRGLSKPETKLESKLEPITHPTKVISLASLGVSNRAELAKKFAGPIVLAAREATPSFGNVARNSRNDRKPSAEPTVSNPKDNVAALAAKSPDQGIAENPNEGVQQVVINGNLEFTGGIALTSSNDRVIVFREDEGEKLEPGAVWLRDARYEIFVDRPVGRLVAELRSITGEVLGRGDFELDQLPKLPPNQYRAKGVTLRLGPVPHGIIGRVVNGSVAGSKSYAIADASVLLKQLPYGTSTHQDGVFEEQTLLEGSSVITRSERNGSWGTLAFGHAGQSQDISLFSDQAMRALLKAGAPTEMNSDRSSAYIWGKVTRGGAPVTGAKVDLMTTERKMKPIYFNKLGMPDPELKTTTANGLYAFFPVPPGAHAIQAADVHGITEPNLFPTEERTVTQMDLELKVSKQAKVRVFDAFKTDFPLAAEVMSAGRSRGAMVPRTGELKATFTDGRGLLVLDADAGGSYERVRLTVSRDSRVLDFPMVQTTWIDGLRGASRLSAESNTGTVVGFVRGSSLYRVALEDRSAGPNSKVLYFDQAGNITRNNYGQSGGGFVILNVPTGFRTVLIQPSGTTKALASAVLVDSQVTNVLTKSLQ